MTDMYSFDPLPISRGLASISTASHITLPHHSASQIRASRDGLDASRTHRSKNNKTSSVRRRCIVAYVCLREDGPGHKG